MQATLWNCHCHPVESVLSYVNTRAAYVAGVVRVAQRIALDSCGALGIGGELCHVIAVIYDLELGITGHSWCELVSEPQRCIHGSIAIVRKSSAPACTLPVVGLSNRSILSVRVMLSSRS